jgi:DNA-binding response OmpR family regulator
LPKLLITDDDAELRRIVRTYAELEGFDCTEAENACAALKIMQEADFDILILDVMMPGMDGFEALAEIRRDSQVPVIMLTSRGEEYDKLFAFNLGADDYVPKPFSSKELMARAGAVLKRSGGRQGYDLRFGELVIQPGARTVALAGKSLSLPRMEFELLLTLARNAHIVLTREQLLDKVWGHDYYGDARTVDTHVKSLRERLGEYRKVIQTVWGVGYKFEYRQEL